MKKLLAFATGLILILALGLLAQQKTPPKSLSFASKMGDVTFDHAKHGERVKGDCKVCHDKLWPQDAKAPLNFKAGMHKPAEAGKTACGACHHAGGAAFESKGNCAKCHIKKAA